MTTMVASLIPGNAVAKGLRYATARMTSACTRHRARQSVPDVPPARAAWPGTDRRCQSRRCPLSAAWRDPALRWPYAHNQMASRHPVPSPPSLHRSRVSAPRDAAAAQWRSTVICSACKPHRTLRLRTPALTALHTVLPRRAAATAGKRRTAVEAEVGRQASTGSSVARFAMPFREPTSHAMQSHLGRWSVYCCSERE